MLGDPKTVEVAVCPLLLLVFNFEKACEDTAVVHGDEDKGGGVDGFTVVLDLGFFERL